jgi:hypothetical protein
VTGSDLEQALRNFDRIATLVSDRAPKQVWKFEFQSKAYFLHFHRRSTRWKRLFHMSPALAQFINLQAMQRAGVPSPRAAAHLTGFRLRDEIGDAVIVASIDNAAQLDQFLRDQRLKGFEVPNRRQVVKQVIDIVEQVGRAKFGHRRLDLGCFLVADGKVYLHDVQDLRSGGLRMKDVFTLGHSAARFASRSELMRGWNRLNPDELMPRKNPLSPKLWKKLERRSLRENEDFGAIRSGVWKGHFTKSNRFAVPWSLASRLKIGGKDWETGWPALLTQIQSDQLETVKRDASGEIFSGEIVLAARPIRVFIKHPARRYLHRYLLDLFRPARPRRMWAKSWNLIALGLPCEFPLAVFERTVLGYSIDSYIIFERVPGTMLDRVDLDEMPPKQREMLFRRAGHILRAIEHGGLAHYDSKSVNWIVFEDPLLGPLPVMIDLDGIRTLYSWLVAWGIHRLLRAMKQHPQYTPEDSLALCQGYAPFVGKFEPEKIPEES